MFAIHVDAAIQLHDIELMVIGGIVSLPLHAANHLRFVDNLAHVLAHLGGRGRRDRKREREKGQGLDEAIPTHTDAEHKAIA